MKKSKRIIFNVLSILFLLSLVVFYGYRLFYYYSLEHKSYVNKTVYLYQKLIDNKGIEGTDQGLLTKDNMYIYASKSTDNYLYYLGRMWRIVSIDEQNNIKMITEDIQTVLTWDDETEFSDSNINYWLNKSDEVGTGIFESSLKDDVNIMKQNNLTANLLTKSEYELLNSNNNYLINKEPFWILDDNKLLYVDSKGNVNDEIGMMDFYGVRPSIILSSEAIYVSGTGIKDDPYIISDAYPEKIRDAYVGEYVNYGNYNWRIIGIDSDKIKIVLDGVLDTEKAFSSRSNIYSVNDGIGSYLNTEFLSNLVNNDYIVAGDFPTGFYVKNNIYSYLNTFSDSVNANVGLLKLGDFFINEYPNIYTMTPYVNTKKTIHVINNNSKVYADFIDEEYKIRPVVYVNSELFVIGGKGTKEEPYEIGR